MEPSRQGVCVGLRAARELTSGSSRSTGGGRWLAWRRRLPTRVLVLLIVSVAVAGVDGLAEGALLHAGRVRSARGHATRAGRRGGGHRQGRRGGRHGGHRHSQVHRGGRRAGHRGGKRGSGGLPDLVVHSATVSLQNGDVVVGKAVVGDVGDARARSSTAGVDWREGAQGDVIELGRFDVSVLEPKREHETSFSVPVPAGTAAGSYVVSVCADVLSQVRERSEKNNCRVAGTVTITAGSAGTSTTGTGSGSGTEGLGGGSSGVQTGPTPDITPPETTITSGPSGWVDSTTAVFSFSSSETRSSFQCSLDGGAWATCTSPQSYESLSQGQHAFQVRAVGQAGNIDPTPAQTSWAVDTIPPTVSLTAPANGSSTNDDKPAFSGAAGTEPGDSSAISLAIYQGSTATGTPVQTLTTAASSGTWSLTPTTALADGTYTAQVTQADAAGNTGSGTVTFTINNTPPITTIVSAPSGRVSINNAEITFGSSKPESSFECSLNGATYTPCASPDHLNGIPPGPQTFKVRAIDKAGNTDPSPAAIEWDYQAPKIELCGPVLHDETLSQEYAAVYVLTCPVDVEHGQDRRRHDRQGRSWCTTRCEGYPRSEGHSLRTCHFHVGQR